MEGYTRFMVMEAVHTLIKQLGITGEFKATIEEGFGWVITFSNPKDEFIFDLLDGNTQVNKLVIDLTGIDVNAYYKK